MRDMDAEARAVNKWLNLSRSAKKRGLDFDLTVSEVKVILRRKNCYFLGTPMQKGPIPQKDGTVVPRNTLTIDRIDSTKGYVTGNVVACTSRINEAKNDLSLEELETLVKKLKEISK